MNARECFKPYRIANGRKFRLKDIDPADTNGFDISKKEARALLEDNTKTMAELQDKLYAQNRWAVLAMFQAMDAAGKDGTIRHVMSGVNPQGCQVYSFKVPSAEELDHDFLWRCTRALPERGRIGIFNRSYYEEVLVVRVHQDFLARQHLPEGLAGKDVWDNRFEDIRNFERYLTRNGVRVLKFFLHVSKHEQKKRFLERISLPEKNWKFSAQDVAQRAHWDEYQRYYEDMIRNTATAWAPWYVVPADNKWFTRLVVGHAMVAEMQALDLAYPKLPPAEAAKLAAAKAALEMEKS